ncbi:uncharacterized protein LOC114440809 [Parambassis ranga]|uniref:Uncharacterized protein LOC114440809 n=1 Tax=Parambassis ranga TaxID=210632 RepID=A0A6P7IW95_9TELE|nr:uncharacterized protein LOC114440809 [Parambassis ranga]
MTNCLSQCVNVNILTFPIMGNAQSYIVASLSVCSLYFVYVHIYRAHKVLKSNVLESDKLPSFVYLYIKYFSKSLTRKTGNLYATQTRKKCESVYTVLSCRMETLVLRRFCSAAGYGWDYPDSEYRDIPLCFPEFLCGRLLLMLLTDENFRLSPAGLVRVRQSVKTLQPIDELKKGPFMLRIQVLAYQQTDAGVEVDVCLSATSRSGCLVWESVLTLLSKSKSHTSSSSIARTEHKDFFVRTELTDEPAPENVKQVEVRVPRTTTLQRVGIRSQTASSLWMLSVCLAEIEKHKGVAVITAPVTITAQFKELLLVPGKATVRFWEEKNYGDQSSLQALRFNMQQPGHSIPHIVGLILRS